MAGGAGNFGGTVIDIADATDNIGHRSCDNKIRHNMTERIHIMRIGQGYDCLLYTSCKKSQAPAFPAEMLKKGTSAEIS